MTYDFYRASIVSLATETDLRQTVRVLPHMIDIADESTLPKFPAFLKTQLHNFPIGTVVWVLAVEDFSVGYILGQSNIFTEEPNVHFYNFTDKINVMNDISLAAGGGFHSFSDLVFLYVDSNIIEAINIVSGAKITYHSNGSIYVQSKKGIFMKYGSSSIEINENEINIRGKNVSIAADESVFLSSAKGNQSGGSGYVLVSTTPNSFTLPNGAVVAANAGVQT